MKSVAIHIRNCLLFSLAGLGFAWLISHFLNQDQRVQYYLSFATAFLLLYAISTLLKKYSNVANIDSSEIGLPGGTKFCISISKNHQTAAWEIFIEIMTRVGANKLTTNEGRSDEARDSIYQLFQRCREILLAMGPSPKSTSEPIEIITLRLLNKELRPFLTKWRHASPNAAGSFHKDDVAFRSDLSKLQTRIIQNYSVGFSRLAGFRDSDKIQNVLYQ